jgi:WD40 repeat protein
VQVGLPKRRWLRARDARSVRLGRMRSLPRGVVWVTCGAMLAFAQTALQLGDPQPWWSHVLAAALVAGIAIASEVDRHRHHKPLDSVGEGRLSSSDLAADRLAEVMRNAWATEAKRRGITTPVPASVRWHWAAADVAAPRSEVVAPAVPGLAPGSLVGTDEGGLAPAGPLESGVVTRLHDEVYARLAHGRLVILGAPGAGKTGSMILLMLQALQHRATMETASRALIPVPVWLTLGGWDPATQSLREWALTVIDREHPYLRSAMFEPDTTATLLDRGRLALFLDGLDELAPTARSAALQRLDAELVNLRVVLSSRPEEYRQALDRGHWHNAAVIELRPIRPTVAATFLLRDQVGRQREAWAAVGDYLRGNPGSVAAQVLSTPLTLTLARAAYQHSDPTELVVPKRFSSAADLRAHLVERVLVAAYPDEALRQRTTRWLSWLAHHMGVDREVGWWEIPTWVSRWQLAFVMAGTAMLTGLITTGFGSILLGMLYPTESYSYRGAIVTVGGVPGRTFVDGFVLQLGVVGGAAIWAGSEVMRRRSLGLSRAVRLNPRMPRRGEYAWLVTNASITGFGLGIGVGLLSGLGSVTARALDRAVTDGWAAQVVDSAELSAALSVVFAVGLGVGIPAGLVIGIFGVWSMPDERAVSASPRGTYVNDRRARTSMSLFAGGAVALSVGVVAGAFLGATAGLLYAGIAGVTVALLARVTFGVSSALQFAEFLVNGPRLMRLLEDALAREVLRQAGSVYQFRHAELQDHLARAFQPRQTIVSDLANRLRSRAHQMLPPPHRRRHLVIVAAVAMVAAVVVASMPIISAIVRPDHVTLTDTPVEDLAFSPDGSLLLCAGDGVTVVWKVATERVLHTYRGEAVGATSTPVRMDPGTDALAFGRDGSTLATAEGPVVRWWNVTSRENVKTLMLDPGLEVLGFSPDRRYLAALDGTSGNVSLWNAATGEPTGTIPAWSFDDLDDPSVTLTFSPDGKTLATSGDASGLTRVWTVPSAALVTNIPGTTGGAAFSPDSNILAVPTGTALSFYDLPTFEVSTTGPIGGDLVTFGPGDTLAVGSVGFGRPDKKVGLEGVVNEGGRLRLWDVESETLTRTLDADSDKLLTHLTTFSPDGERVATGWVESGWNLDSDLWVWDVSGDAPPRALGRGNRALRSMAFSSDGRTLATGWEDRRVRIWQLP